MNTNFTKKDILIVAACVVFLMINLGAIGSAGRQKAMESVCLSNLKQWGNVFQMWLNDHDGTFMGGRNEKWFNALAPYYGAELRDNETRREYKLRFCPAAMGFADEGAQQPFAAWKQNSMGGGLESWMSYYWDGSYGSNSWMYNSFYAQAWKTANVKNSSEIPMLLDSAQFGGRPTETDPPPEYDGDTNNSGQAGYFMKQFSLNRHNGSVNGVFMDFSCRAIGIKELWTLRWHRTYRCSTPSWPEWMRGFKDYGCKIEPIEPMAR